MAWLDGKYSIKINGEGYLVSHRSGKHYYQKKIAPQFVNKFGSGDSSYRDATFWQFWVQSNWRNGAKQLKFDDAGKYWKSSNLDVGELERLQLSHKLVSIGQTAAGETINDISSWRSSQSWWNSNYGYRKQLTVTAPSAQAATVGYPIVVTEDTAALQTASKVRSDRNDWRVLYWNGSSWVDLSRDYLSTAKTVFALQAAIPAGATDTNYYLYYGYAAESTNKQPTTDAEWNAVYGMYGTTFDANTLAVYHFDNGSGTTVTDRDGAYDVTASGMTWGTDGRISRYGNFSGSGDYASNTSTDFNLGSFTYECLYYTGSAVGGTQMIVNRVTSGDSRQTYFNVKDGKLELGWDGASSGSLIGGTTLSASTWYWVGASYDGSTARLFLNGTQDGSKSDSGGVVTQPSATLWVGKKTTGGGDETNGRIAHLRISNAGRSAFPHHLATDPTVLTGSEITTQPPSSSFTAYIAASSGKIYTWDGNTTLTEVYDTSRILSFDSVSGGDTDYQVGDLSGTEYARAMGFQLSAEQAKSKMSGLSMYLKKNAGTPGDITVRIETNSAGVPSGTLADASATGTIVAFTTSAYGWVNVTFPAAFSLSATTTYWIVLKTAAASNDNNYAWLADGSSPAYASGNMASSNDGGSTWTAIPGSDAYFRVLGNSTSANTMLVTQVGGTQKMLIGTGKISSQENGDARIYSFDGTSFSLDKVFNTATESQVLSLAEYNSKVYAGVGVQARVYETSNLSTWTLSKDISVPQNPGYIYTMKEYNSRLIVGGGSPEFLPGAYYNGFSWTYDSTTWYMLYSFDFTVIKSMEFYDSFLFLGTYGGQLFVYDTSSLNPLFNFKFDYGFKQSISDMKYYDDKLYVALYPQEGSGDTNSSIWVFDRHGLSSAHSVSGVTGYTCMEQVNNQLLVGTGTDGMVYKVDVTTYAPSGTMQTSYFDANLPSIDKLWNQVVIKHDPLPAGTSVSVSYRFKEEDGWTSLGTSSVIGSTEKTLSIPASVLSKKISLLVTLETTNSTATPVVTETVLRYTLMPERKWLWNLRVLAKKNLQLADGTLEPRTAAEIRQDLEDAQNSQGLVQFIDADGIEYTTLFTDVDQTSWVLNPADENEDELVVSLREA